MKYGILTLSLLGLAAGQVQAVANPSSVYLKVYELRLSPNTDCSGAVTVFRDAAGITKEFVGNPTIANGAIPNGTYRCMIMKMSDHITYTPATTDGANCIQGTSYIRDLFRVGDTCYDPDGNAIAGRGASASNGTEDGMWLYFSTTGNNANTCYRASDPCLLGGPAVVNGDDDVTFVANFDGMIDGTSNPCELTGAEFSFR